MHVLEKYEQCLSEKLEFTFWERWVHLQEEERKQVTQRVNMQVIETDSWNLDTNILYRLWTQCVTPEFEYFTKKHLGMENDLLYLNDLPVCLIYLVYDCRSVFHKLPHGIYVIVRDEQQVFWPWTKEDLIFERHDHQLIKLQEEKKEKKKRCEI